MCDDDIEFDWVEIFNREVAKPKECGPLPSKLNEYYLQYLLEEQED